MDDPRAKLPVEISKFWANRRGEAAIVSLREYEGVVVVDVRKHYVAASGRLAPTKKGIALVVRKLPELAKALAKAERMAIKLGLLPDQAAP
jgi:Transcriptional Coactivator p15 (PC4)